ncbi:MAG: maleylacetoacetate isomerase [Rhodobacteraceae bacterium]|nr:maleylacetoacetate isomerase [Paracoccaceae bacterium]
MILYSYWRSTTSYRVRVALNLKGIPFTTKPINLVEGEQCSADYKRLNPSMGVPALQINDDVTLTQSMAILSYLESVNPTPAMLPSDPIKSAEITAASNVIACDIHPVNNLKVVNKVKSLGANGVDWMIDWMNHGLMAYQELIEPQGKYSFGDDITLADICLVPQLYNAHRWGVDLTPFKRLVEIEKACLMTDAFQKAHPNNQPDSEIQ